MKQIEDDRRMLLLKFIQHTYKIFFKSEFYKDKEMETRGTIVKQLASKIHGQKFDG